MRGSERYYLGCLLAVALSAAGCITAAPTDTTAEVPLTPYSPLVANQSGRRAVEHGPNQVGGMSMPQNRAPTADDLDLIEPTNKPSWADRLEALSPKKLNARFKEMVGLGPDEELARSLYTEADALFREGRYAEAAKKYKQASKRWPDSSLQEDAMFMQAESNFQSDRYPKTSDIYTVLLKKYENSRHLDMIVKRRFAIARYWEYKGTDRGMFAFNFTDKSIPFWDVTGNTVAVYESIRMDDPTGPLADDATMATANTYFLKGRWEDAGYHYDLMRTEFPQSEFQPQAHLLGMQAKLRSYQGPDYDSKPLEEARKLAHTLQTQYAAQMPNEREHIAEVERTIDAQLAQRDYSRGEFYYKTKHYGAARYYYAQILRDHPQTQFAELAKARGEALKDAPPEPANEIEWVATRWRNLTSPKSATSTAPGTDAPNPTPADKTVVAQQPQGR